jgi:hypothetical protein
MLSCNLIQGAKITGAENEYHPMQFASYHYMTETQKNTVKNMK